MSKTDAAAQTLKQINPDVEFESYCHNITTTDNFNNFSMYKRDLCICQKRPMYMSKETYVYLLP